MCIAVVALGLSGARAMAEDAFIRIEAKRGTAAEAALVRWQERFPDAVAFELDTGLTGIALGPQSPAEAAQRMAELKASGAIPADSYLTGPGGDTPLTGVTEALAAGVTGDAETGTDESAPGGDAGADEQAEALETPEAVTGAPEAATDSDSSEIVENGDAGTATVEAEAPAAAAADPADSQQVHIQLQATPGSVSAQEALARWRRSFPEAQLFRLPGGWFAVALPAQPVGEARTRLAAIIADRSAPGDAFLTPVDRIGTRIDTADDAADEADEAEADAATETQAATPRPSDPRQASTAALDPDPAVGAVTPEDATPTPEVTVAPDEIPEPDATSAPDATPGPDAIPEADATLAPQDATAKPAASSAPEDATPAQEATPAPEAMPEPDATSAPDPATPVAEATPAPTVTPAPAPAVMPSTEEAQRVLRWAGLYDGAIDGKAGPGTEAAIDAAVAAAGGTASPAEAVTALVAERAAWRDTMGLETLTDDATGLSLSAPMKSLTFDRTERALSIYGPQDGSGAALILFTQEGGQQELSDLAGLVTALGWVPSPVRDMARGRFTLRGADDVHAGYAEGRLADGLAEGWVLIWPASDAANGQRLAAEAADSLTRVAPPVAPDLSPPPNQGAASGPDSTRTGAAAAPRP